MNQAHPHSMEFDVHITEALLRRVAVRTMFRRWALSLAAAVLIGIGVSIDLVRGSLGTVSIMGISALGFLLLVYAGYYVRQRQMIAEWKRLQGDAPVHYILTAETVRATSNLGSTELRWHVIRELREHADYILLGLGRSGHLTLPREEIPPAALEFIRERLSMAGAPTKPA